MTSIPLPYLDYLSFGQREDGVDTTTLKKWGIDLGTVAALLDYRYRLLDCTFIHETTYSYLNTITQRSYSCSIFYSTPPLLS